MAAIKTPREKLIEEIQLRLGMGIIDLELDPPHYNYAIDVALGRYRQRSGNAIEESFVFLEVQPDQSTYTLPDEVQEVRSVYRSSFGGTSGVPASDPFSLATTQSFYSILNPGGLGGGGAGSLATYDFAQQYISLAARMFGRDLLFNFDRVLKRILFHRKFVGAEQVALYCYNTKPEAIVLMDPYARPWLRDYSIAVCKQIMGEARSKFGSIAGPSGGITLNGEALKTEAQADMERLEKELVDLIDQNQGGSFIIG